MILDHTDTDPDHLKGTHPIDVSPAENNRAIAACFPTKGLPFFLPYYFRRISSYKTKHLITGFLDSI